MSADYFGLISGNYSGPEEIRQFYLYGGLLLLPLAIAGLMRRIAHRAAARADRSRAVVRVRSGRGTRPPAQVAAGIPRRSRAGRDLVRAGAGPGARGRIGSGLGGGKDGAKASAVRPDGDHRGRSVALQHVQEPAGVCVHDVRRAVREAPGRPSKTASSEVKQQPLYRLWMSTPESRDRPSWTDRSRRARR